MGIVKYLQVYNRLFLKIQSVSPRLKELHMEEEEDD